MRLLWRRRRLGSGKGSEGKGRGKERKEEKGEKAPVKKQGERAIKKGIYFSVLVYVEGEQEAAEDFDGPAKAELKRVLGEALEGEHEGLKMVLKGVEVRNDVEEDEGEEKEEKFEF